MDKKILITGSAGFLGSFLYDEIKKTEKEFKVKGISRRKTRTTDMQIDLTDEDAVRDFLPGYNPDIIIHCAALTNVDACEERPEEAKRQNVDTTRFLLKYSGKKAHFIYISTDYVYDGKKGSYRETNKLNPLSVYGKTKSESERLVREYRKKHTILRPTVIYGWHPEGMNFFMQVYRNLKKNKRMRIPTDQISNPTYIKTLIRIIVETIKKEIKGTYNSTGPESLDRYSFSKKISRFFKLNENLLEPVSTEKLKKKAARPLNCSTDNTKIRNRIVFNIPSIEDTFKDIKKDMANMKKKKNIKETERRSKRGK